MDSCRSPKPAIGVAKQWLSQATGSEDAAAVGGDESASLGQITACLACRFTQTTQSGIPSKQVQRPNAVVRGCHLWSISTGRTHYALDVIFAAANHQTPGYLGI
jgi:hypothetical protein